MKFLLLAVLSTAALTTACAGEPELVITSPKAGAEVGTSSQVSGTINDSVSEIWVICRMVGTSDFWVQCPATVSPEDKTWKGADLVGGSVRFATEGDAIGREFELIAVADPVEILTRGQLLKACPNARLTSEPVKVTKTKE